MQTPSTPPRDAASASAFERSRPQRPFRDVRFGPVDIALEARTDGTLLLSNRQPLGALPVTRLTDYLHRYAADRPDAVFLAEPAGGDEWRELNWRQALQGANGVAQWLLSKNLTQSSIDGAQPDAPRPILVLSENSIHHALLQLGAMQAGIPVMPVSPAYSLMSEDCARIAALVRRYQPVLIYAAGARRYARAIERARAAASEAGLPAPIIVCDDGGDAQFAELLATEATAAVGQAHARVGLDHVARYLLTSGSTGVPKAVRVTHRNMVASGVLWDQCWPFLSERRMRLVDWLPWNHTAGANGSFNMALRHGGTLYIDDGKPMPGLVERTVANLKRFKPTLMVNVPRGLDMLALRMEEDPSVAEAIFPGLDVIVYGGASLSPQTWLKLETASAQVTGRRIPVLSSLGSTETTTPATLTWWPPHRIGSIGLPAPGVEAKLVPDGDQYEVRFRGQNITTGYVGDARINDGVFDEEGYLKTGDAVRFIDPDEPRHGLLYAGRIAENFKLSTGTWVSVSGVRDALLGRLHPLVADVVLAGHDTEQLGALLLLNVDQVRKRLAALADADGAAIVLDAALQRVLAEAIQAYNAEHPGSSTRIARALLQHLPPDPDAGEVTDKGHVNQRAVLRRRADAVQRLYAAHASGGDCLLFPVK